MNEPTQPPPPGDARRGLRRRATWKRRAIGLGAVAAVLSGGLAVLANLSEIAGWFRPDDTRELVEETRAGVQATEAQVESLVMLLKNQAAASGISLDLESDDAIRNAIEAIVASGNAQKQSALGKLDAGDAQGAADAMARVAAEQARAASTTGDVAAESWREAGGLYYGIDTQRAVEAYREADRLQPGHPETLEMLAHSLARTGRLDEARQAFERVLELDASPAVRAAAQGGLGNLARQQGDYAQARAHLEEALSLATEHGLEAERIHVLTYLGGLAREQGDLAAAQRYLDSALAHAEGMQDESVKASILGSLGTLAAARGDLAHAEELLGQALQIHRKTDNLSGKASALGNLGAVALMDGDLDTAEVLLQESVAVGHELGWTSSIVSDLINLGGIATERGDFEAAEDHLLEAETLARDAGLAELTPIIVYNRGDIARERGDLDSACRLWSEAEPLLSAMGSAHANTAREQLARAECPQASTSPGASTLN